MPDSLLSLEEKKEHPTTSGDSRDFRESRNVIERRAFEMISRQLFFFLNALR